MPSPSDSFEQAVEAFYRLNVGVVGTGADRHERPHKPVMLLAVMDLIAQGKARPDRIPWSQSLRERFALYFGEVQKLNDQCTPENPFLYLRQEQWWQPKRITSHGAVPLESTPTVKDSTEGTVFAMLADPVASWMITPADRLRLRDALISRFFPHARADLALHFHEGPVQESSSAYEAEPEDEDTTQRPGRSSGFRRIILDIYDYQCAACGLRIKLPQLEDLTFVDAAHLIPFKDPEKGGNDHPTNGIALCKNHHWAMDRFLIAPTPAHEWQVSPLIDPRRSQGESELHALRGRTLLLPHDEAFAPNETALEWRLMRLAS